MQLLVVGLGNSFTSSQQGNFRDILVDRKANALISDFVARKIRQRVNDPAVAEKLIPKNHGFGTRRVPLETRYYEVYNQPNVELVDVNETPLERITAVEAAGDRVETGRVDDDVEFVFGVARLDAGGPSTSGASTDVGSRTNGRRGRRPFSASWWKASPIS
jgi:cation diffusion facilitator CzcD-associated flavoprotein CzcO